MNVALQIRIADGFYQAGRQQIKNDPAQARKNLGTAKEIIQLCLRANPPDLNKEETRIELERVISQIRELLVGLELAHP
uniref:DUF1844 domain-containing protein n=1 Tax=candidate division WWE3 bacterium TaxID=2053526 RepID=A0A832E1Z2_UNCKA